MGMLYHSSKQEKAANDSHDQDGPRIRRSGGADYDEDWVKRRNISTSLSGALHKIRNKCSMQDTTNYAIDAPLKCDIVSCSMRHIDPMARVYEVDTNAISIDACIIATLVQRRFAINLTYKST